jgi:hypothetical protein
VQLGLAAFSKSTQSYRQPLPDLDVFCKKTVRSSSNAVQKAKYIIVEIAFTLPLHKESASASGASSVNTSPTDQGYDTQESKDCHGSNDEGDDEKEDEVDDEADEEWLQSMGVGVAEIKKLNSAQSNVSVCSHSAVNHNNLLGIYF